MPHSTVIDSTSKRRPRDLQTASPIIRNALLILLSLALLPLGTAILICSYVLRLLLPRNPQRDRRRSSSAFYPKTILVTGVGMTKGLTLARMFYEAGHDVIGADFEPDGVPVNGRVSRALKKFYRFTPSNTSNGPVSYIDDLLRVVRREKVDLWVSCSGVASAAEDGQAKEVIERRTSCRAIQYDVNLTETLHSKDSFIRHTESLGLKVPETHEVTSRATVHRLLHNAQDKRYIMKSVGVDDASRGDLTLLPRPSVNETYQHVAAIDISQKNPWVLQQFILGNEYCTHALVVDGNVKVFVACPSSELLMHYEPLPPDSTLSKAMLEFTTEFVSRTGQNMTGHLSFDFLVDERMIGKGQGIAMNIYPIECNPRAHTAVVLFKGAESEMTDAYLSAVEPGLQRLTNGQSHESPRIVVPRWSTGYYWAGHDLVALVLLPLWRCLTGTLALRAMVRDWSTFVEHVFLWRDGTFEFWDPLPWWWLYHVYWPGKFLASLQHGDRWSRINVSTTKMFAS
ncbi:MAG: hypothetical protein M1833_000121 [Piccolia ochrophora]|nr:MAG: hypothetical protein M1833_000121 [Piccolia ochrophora]